MSATHFSSPNNALGIGILPQNFTSSFQLSIKTFLHTWHAPYPYVYVLWHLQIWLKLHVKWGILGETSQCLSHPTGRLRLIYFNKTFRIAYWNLLEQIRILKYRVRAIWKIRLDCWAETEDGMPSPPLRTFQNIIVVPGGNIYNNMWCHNISGCFDVSNHPAALPPLVEDIGLSRTCWGQNKNVYRGLWCVQNIDCLIIW